MTAQWTDTFMPHHSHSTSIVVNHSIFSECLYICPHIMHRTLSHKLLSTCLCRLPMSLGAGMRPMLLSCVYQQVSLIFSSKYHLFFPAFSMHSTWAASWSHVRMMPGKGWPWLYMTTQYCPSSLSDRTTGHCHLLSAAVFEALKIPGIDIPVGTVLAFLGIGPLARTTVEIGVLILSCVILGLNPVLPVLHIYIYF